MKIYEISGDVEFLQIEFEENVTELMKREEPRRKAEIWGKVELHTIKGTHKKGTPLGDCPYYGPSRLIVSEKLKEVIQTFTEDEIEFLPVEIDEITGYWFMNVLCVLNALDTEKSELKLFDTGRIKYVIQAKYHENVIDGHDIFKLTNYSGIFISERLKNVLENSSVVGITYRDTTEKVENPLTELVAKPKIIKTKTKRTVH